MLILLAVLFVALIAGIPVAFSIAISSAAYLILFSGVPLLARSENGGQVIPLLFLQSPLLGWRVDGPRDIVRIVSLPRPCWAHTGGMAMVMAISCMFLAQFQVQGLPMWCNRFYTPSAMNEQGYKAF